MSDALAHERSTTRFGGLRIEYDARVLEPREWTTLQSRWAVEVLAEAGPGPVLELCTGAGHIGLLAAVESGRALVAVDLNPVACDFARHNAQAAGLASRVEVRQGDFADVLADDEIFVAVIADPPWVTTEDIGTFPDDPTLAIDGGSDGLSVARACIVTAARHLLPGGHLLLQLGNEAQCNVLMSEVTAQGAWSEAGRRSGERGVILGLVLRDAA